MIYNGFIRVIFVSSLPIMLGILLNLRYGINSSDVSIINTCSALLAIFGFILFSYKITKLIMRYSNDLENAEYKSRFDLLTEEIKSE